MTAALSIENSVNNLNKFVADVGSGANNYYYFIGRTLPWPIDTQPPIANTSYQEMESVYHDMVCGKLITNNNVSPLIPYTPWVANTVIQQYDQSAVNLFSVSFYVVTPDYSVYKCIDNNNGSPSTIIPSLKLTQGVFESSDGYTWKYMFTIPSASNTLFTTTAYVPVVPNTSVTSSAVAGTVDAFRIQNGGANYQGYHEGMIQNVISPSSIQLAANAVPIDNFYTGSSLYLKTGLGAGQISNIYSYQGSSQIAYVYPPFNTFLNIQLGTLNGTFSVGEYVSQVIDDVSYLYQAGWFNPGDQVIQSDTNNGSGNNISAYVGTSNSSVMTLINLNSNTNFSISNPYPIINTRNAGVLLTGNVTTANGSNQVTGVSANLLNCSINQYIRVGSNANNNIRRITSITNSSVANVSVPFNASLVNQNFYSMPYAVEPISEVQTVANGVITATNINGTILNYANVSSLGSSFTLGELVKEFSNTGIDLAANGIVSFVNTSVVVLSNLNGTMTIGNEMVGQTSSLQATISGVVSYPSITLTNVVGTFETGFPIYAFNTIGGSTANAIPISTLTIPSDDVEYVVSPVATITGDGVGALAYCIVNNAVGSTYPIARIVPINVGNTYTYANVTITSPNLYGSGANVSCVVSPPDGHGSDPISELGGRFLGISMTFDTAINENYKFPNYGTYRRAGIILNPAFNDIFFNIGSTLRNNLNITSIVGSFANGEIIFQPTTNAAATIVTSNTTFIQIQNINKTFGNAAIVGLTSNATANITSSNTLGFQVNGFGDQPIYDLNSNSVGTLTQIVSNNEIRMANVIGMFSVGDTLYDPLANSYAKIISIYNSNNTVNLANSFGYKFNQTCRIPLTSNVGSFVPGERVTQAISGGNGLVIDTTHEIDIVYTVNNGTISTGTPINDVTSGANGIVTFANSSYMRITGVQGSFYANDNLTCVTGNGHISTVYPVIVLSDVLDFFSFGSQYIITGANSGAIGVNLNGGTIVYPDLTKNTGSVLYVNDLQPFNLSLTSKELFQIVLAF